MHDRELIEALQGLGRPAVAVIGDFMLDRFVWGDALRVSPEAPVPVVHSAREEERPGGAGNVAANVTELGGSALCFGVVGPDRHGETLRALLQASGADCGGVRTDATRPTTQKIRVMARSQQMLRIDRERADALAAELVAELLAALRSARWDAVILSDYGKGLLTEELVAGVTEEARRRGAASLVDPKHRDFARYRGATLITPNRAEAELAGGRPLGGPEALAEGGEDLRRRAGVDGLLITLGAEGMYFLFEGRPPVLVSTRARAVYDVTGAGDTVLAMLAVARAGGLEWETSVRLANAAAGLAVAKVGTATVGRNELLHHLHDATPVHKTVPAGDSEALAAALGVFRREGRRIVFTNGCFDILHAGHVRYLQEARKMGDALVVGLNDDASVTRLKGPERPFHRLEDRAEILAALECVDLVVPFGEDTPEQLIRAVVPEVLVKGADWREKGIVGAEFVESRGGVVRLVDLLPGRSTTGLAQRIRSSQPGDAELAGD